MGPYTIEITDNLTWWLGVKRGDILHASRECSDRGPYWQVQGGPSVPDWAAKVVPWRDCLSQKGTA